jgi:DNA-binding response OmpR family regulator
MIPRKNLELLSRLLREEGHERRAGPRFGENDAAELGAGGCDDARKRWLQDLSAAEAATISPSSSLTARTEIDNLVKAFKLGVVDYVRQPFSSSEIRSRVRATS